MPADKNYEKVFVTRTGFGLKKKYYSEAIKKIKELAKRESNMAKKTRKKNGNKSEIDDK